VTLEDVAVPEAPTPEALETAGTRPADGLDERFRWVFRAACALVILPVYVAAVRNGLHHWVPTWDAATTTVRVNDVFSRHPPLIGMWSSASGWSGHQINFIGALQLYLLAVPVKLLGTTWGVLLGMATLNSAALLTGAWLIRRRVGYRLGLVGCAFLASLVWAVGSEVVVDITPMQMGVMPYMLLLLAAWSVADLDLAAIPILALVGNYLFLDHLTFALAVPVLTVWSLALLAWGLRRRRRDDRPAWPATRRRLVRFGGLAVALTVVVWLPPLYQQVFGRGPGNLGALLSASGAKPPYVPKALGALSAVVATVAVPPLWFRPSFRVATFNADGAGTSFLKATIAAAVLLGLYALGLWAARRRADRTSVVGLTTGLVALLVGFGTTKKSTNPFGLRVNYLHSLWPMSVFVWLVLVLALIRTWPAWSPKVRPSRGLATAGLVAVAVTAVFSVLALPSRDLGAGTPAWTVPLARSLQRQLPAKVRGKGPILVEWSGATGAWALWPSVMLDLQAAGVPFKVATVSDQHQFGLDRAFQRANPNARYALLVSSNRVALPGYHRIAEAHEGIPAQVAEFERLDQQVHAWAKTVHKLELDPATANQPAKLMEPYQQMLNGLVAKARASGTSIADSPVFVMNVSNWYDEAHHKLVVQVPGIDPVVLHRWAKLSYDTATHDVYVYLAPIGAALANAGPLTSTAPGPVVGNSSP